MRDGREKEARRELGKRVWPAKKGQERVRIIGDGDSMCTEYKAPTPPPASRALGHGPSASESCPLNRRGVRVGAGTEYLALAQWVRLRSETPRSNLDVHLWVRLPHSPHGIAWWKWVYHKAAGPETTLPGL